MTHQYKVGDKVRSLVGFGAIYEGDLATVIAVWNEGREDAGVDVKTSDGRISEFFTYEIEPVTDTPDTPKTWGEMTDADLLEFADRIRAHLDISQNHEAGLIPMSTQAIMTELADALKPEPVVEVVDKRIYINGIAHGIRVTLTDDKPTKAELVE